MNGVPIVQIEQEMTELGGKNQKVRDCTVPAQFIDFLEKIDIEEM